MKYIKYGLFLLLNIFFATPVLAAPNVSDSGGNPPQLVEITGILDNVTKYIFPVAGLICVIFVVYGGYMWMISAGDPARVKAAQGTLTWAIIGLVFLLVIFAILKALVSFVTA